MAQRTTESFINDYVIQTKNEGRWRSYKIIARRDALRIIANELIAALDKPEAQFRQSHLAPEEPTTIVKLYVTEANGRTDRIQLHFSVAADLDQYHQPERRRKKPRDYALIGAIITVAALAIIGAVAVGWYVLLAIDWVLFSHHRV